MTKNRYQNDQINLERTKADQMAFGFNNLQSFVINSCNHYITAYILHNYKLTFTAWNFLGKRENFLERKLSPRLIVSIVVQMKQLHSKDQKQLSGKHIIPICSLP